MTAPRKGREAAEAAAVAVADEAARNVAARGLEAVTAAVEACEALASPGGEAGPNEGRYTNMKETSARLCLDARAILVHTAGRNGETKASVVNHVIKRLDEQVKRCPALYVRRLQKDSPSAPPRTHHRASARTPVAA